MHKHNFDSKSGAYCYNDTLSWIQNSGIKEKISVSFFLERTNIKKWNLIIITNNPEIYRLN